jgi:glycine/D-amino acid oxidase-like deaminating enzyme
MKFTCKNFTKTRMFVQSDRHVASYYAAAHPAPIPQRPELDERIDADVLVVGAGFSGLHTALRLALAGKRVVVLEASRVGWAASGRNGGQALLGWSCDMQPLEDALGRDGARLLWDSMRWAAAEVRELPVRHGFDIDTGPAACGPRRPRRVALLAQARDEAAERWSYDRLRVIDKDEMPAWIGSARYLAALHDPEAGHLNPLKLALGLAQTIERAGARIYEQSRVLDCRETPDGHIARTARGELRADVLVLACNAYVDRLDPALSRRLLPVGTYQVATAPLAPALARAAAARQLRDRQPVRARLLPPEPG